MTIDGWRRQDEQPTMNDKNLQIGSIVVAKSINFIDARGLENRLSKTNTNANDGTTGGTTGGTTDGTTDGTTGGTTDGTLKVWNTINTFRRCCFIL